MFYLYRQPEQGELVVIAADPADGGSDSCAAVAKSKKHRDSFMTYNGQLDSAQFGHELYKMAVFIHKHTGEWPLIAPERNTGMATITVLQNYNYPKLFRMPKSIGEVGLEEESEKIGWVTSSVTRPKMIDEFAMVLRQGQTKIPDRETISQLKTFIRKSNGRPEAANGAHDDLVICECIANQVIQISPMIRSDNKAAKIKQFPDQELFDQYGNPNY